MLKELYIQFGIVGLFIVVVVGTLTAVTWLMAIAGVTASSMSRGRKFGLQALLTMMPPLSLFFMGGYLVKEHREAKRIARKDPQSAASIRERLQQAKAESLTMGKPTPCLVPAEC